MKALFFGGKDDPPTGRVAHVTSPPPPTWHVQELPPRGVTFSTEGPVSEVRWPTAITYQRRRCRTDHVVYVTGALERVDAMIIPARVLAQLAE